MATTGTKVPAIKNIPPRTDPELKATLESMKEAQEIRLGRRGDPRDRNVTLRELIDSGLAKQLRENPFDPNAGTGTLDFTANTPLENLAVPPAPVSLEASGAFTAIILNWNGMSASAPYGNHAYTEIWRSRGNNLGGATLRATTPAFIYTDEVGYGETYYYWVRYVSTSNVPGPYNATNGTPATTVEDIAAVMQELSEDLSSLPGYQTLIADEFSDIANDISVLSSATTRVIKSTSAPTQRDDATSLQATDVWIDTDDNNQVYVRNAANTAWVKSRDSSLVTLVGTSSFTGSDLTSAMASAQSDIITATNTNNSQATAITTLQSDLSSAESDISTNATAISSLGTRVTTNEGDITSITSDVTELESTLTGYSSSSTVASAISGLQTQITANDGDITTINSDITALEATLTGYSSSSTVASAISGLQTQITANDGDISSLSSSVTSLQSQITSNDNDISSQASAISSLQTTVTSQGNSITSNASAITSLQSTTGTNSASITSLQTATTNLQNDANAAYVLKVEANGSVSGMVLEANASGAGAGSAVQFVSDKFAIWNGTSGTAPFIVSGGVVYIDNARIQDGAITNAKILDGTIQTAKIGNAQITTAKIGDLQVTDGKINDLTVNKLTGTFAQLETVITGTLSADSINIDNVTLDTNGSGTLIIKSAGVGTLQIGLNAVSLFAIATGNAGTWLVDNLSETTIAETSVFQAPTNTDNPFAVIGNTMVLCNSGTSSDFVRLRLYRRSASTSAGVSGATYSLIQNYTMYGDSGEAIQTILESDVYTSDYYYQYKMTLQTQGTSTIGGFTRTYGPSILQVYVTFR